MHALSFFFPQDGLYGLIRTQVPPYLPSSCIVCIHTQIQLPRALLTQHTFHYTHAQTNQAEVDLSTGAFGKLTSNIITVCLVNSGPILLPFLTALSALRLAQVKTLW